MLIHCNSNLNNHIYVVKSWYSDITFSQHSDETSTDTKNDQAMEHKIADEIDEVLGRANQKDPDADIILTEYNSDGEEDVDTVG